MGRLFFDFVLKEWLEVRIDFANAHIPCLIVLNQLEVDAAEGQNTDMFSIVGTAQKKSVICQTKPVGRQVRSSR